MKKVLLTGFAALLVGSAALYAQNTSPYWSLAGNSNVSSSSKLGTTNAVPLRLFTNNQPRIYIDPNGRVGVGTTSPVRPLHITAQVADIFIERTDNSNGWAAMDFKPAGTLSSTNVRWGTGLYKANTAYQIWNNAGGSDQFFVTLTKEGNFGIATTNPTAKLQVNGTSLFTNTITLSNGGLYSTSSNAGGYAVYGNNTNGGEGVGGNSSYIGVQGNGGSYGVVGTSNSGIGVYGSSTDGAALYATSANSYGVYGRGTTGVYGGGTVYGVFAEAPSGTGYYGVYGHISGNNTSTTPAAIFGYNDQYGYGIAGHCFYGPGVYGYSDKGYSGYFPGSVYAVTYQGSDRKLKQNIIDITSALVLINQLKPKEYEYRQDGNYKLMNFPTGKHYGLIAQDLEQVFPNLIKESQFDTRMAQPPQLPDSTAKGRLSSTSTQTEVINFKAVNYTELIPVLVKAVQELSTQNDSLRQKNETLENRLNKLEAQINGHSIGTTTTFTNSTILEQNTPNPFDHSTSIRYGLPRDFGSAQLLLTDNSGRTIKSVALTVSTGVINLDGSLLSSGSYTYSLLVNGRVVASKQLVVAK